MESLISANPLLLDNRVVGIWPVALAGTYWRRVPRIRYNRGLGGAANSDLPIGAPYFQGDIPCHRFPELITSTSILC
jgi:hypothetical protein